MPHSRSRTAPQLCLQEIACDLCHMNLEGGSGAPCQPRDGGNPISDALPAASGATSMHCSEGGGSPQAMQCTPRSEARTPSVQRQGGGGGGGAIGGGQPSVQSSRHRLGGARCTPMRLLDALPPTSPSDPPGLEGVNLRKASKQGRCMGVAGIARQERLWSGCGAPAEHRDLLVA